MKIIYILAFAWIALLIAFLILFASHASQKALPAPGEIVYSPNSGSLELLLIVIITIVSILLVYFAIHHFLARKDYEKQEWAPKIKEEDKKYSTMCSQIKIIDRD